jgi:glycosidase
MAVLAKRIESAGDLDFTPVGKVFPSPIDWRDQVMYQLLIDRFDDGKEYPPYDPNTTKRGRDDKQACIFQGGKIKGITRRLDYLKNMGITAIWISPPFKNRQDDPNACHGYAIQDYLSVDPRFGTLEDLQELTREAHARGMYVILDIIINHTGDNWAYREESNPFREDGSRYEFGYWRRNGGATVTHEQAMNGNPLAADDGVWPREFQNPDFYKRRGWIRNMSSPQGTEKIDGDFFSLKVLDITRPDVIDALIRVFKYWIAVCDIDGYRMDTITHTEPGPTAIFINAIHEYTKAIGKHNFFIFAEIVSDDATLSKYVGHNTPEPGEKDRYPLFNAVLDFPLHFAMADVIKSFKPPTVLRDRYEHFRSFYRDYSEAGRYFVTFVDNHDQMSHPYNRFMNGVDDPRQGCLAAGFLLCNMGVPCIYYGSEQGFDGGGKSESYVRETMFGGQWGAFNTTGFQFFNPDHPIYKQIAAVAKVRASQPTIRYGREYFREISGDGQNFGHPIDGNCTLAFSRVLDATEILIAMNLTPAPRQDCVYTDAHVNPPGAILTDLLSSDGRAYHVEGNDKGQAYVRIPLDGRQMVILRRKG